MTFPLYRKYPQGQAFFEVISESEFRELKVIGTYYELHHINAKILPERNYLQDLINNPSGNYVKSNRAEFYRELKSCEEQRKRLV